MRFFPLLAPSCRHNLQGFHGETVSLCRCNHTAVHSIKLFDLGYVVYASNVHYLRLRALRWLASDEHRADVISGDIGDWILAGKPHLSKLILNPLIHSRRISKSQRRTRKHHRFQPRGAIPDSVHTHKGYTDTIEW